MNLLIYQIIIIKVIKVLINNEIIVNFISKRIANSLNLKFISNSKILIQLTNDN